MSVEQGLKMIVSGGIVSPDDAAGEDERASSSKGTVEARPPAAE
jgi:uncharacterized membrane protein